jgi:A/G-specific adenine glycosylase
MKTMNTLTLSEALSLTAWFEACARKLPWRDVDNAYATWISEIMLQQTRSEAVIPYYLRFLKELPDVQALAAADEDRLMKLWEGLGYYSRARSLKKAARVLVDQYQGILPRDPKELQKLPGIGPYTAGAIASQAYQVPVPAVDGNVLRVLTRRWTLDEEVHSPALRRQLKASLQDFLDQYAEEEKKKNPRFVSHFNQGLMELGALICLPRSPHCAECPWQKNCQAFKEGKTETLPRHDAPRPRRLEERTILLIHCRRRILLQKRPPHGLLAGLYEFPSAAGFLSAAQAVAYVEKTWGLEALEIHPLPPAKHVFSHLEWHMQGYEIRTADEPEEKDLLLLTKKELADFAVPSAFKVYKDWLASAA